MRRTAARRDHSTQHVTDPGTFRVRAAAADGQVTIAWDYPGSTLLEVRILRSQRRAAQTADEGTVVAADAGAAPVAGAAPADPDAQLIVYDDVSGTFRDTAAQNGCTYFYTLFAREAGGAWTCWGDHRLTPGSSAQGASRTLPVGPLAAVPRFVCHQLRRLLPAAALLLCLAAFAAGPQGAAAETSAPSAGGVGQTTEAEAAAKADARVATVLEGVDAQAASVTLWGGTAGAPAGATVTYRWPADQARDIAAVWPLLKTDDGKPAPPYSVVEHRLRVQDLTALQVDVLLRSRLVVQILPKDGATAFHLREETWPPFSWFPWFTAKPWVLAPVFIAVAMIIIMRAWRRSRAWNRRTPSMTRHDRQFIGRLAVILFLIAGLVWQVYEAIYAASMPTVDAGGVTAGQLVTLPLLLFPPAVFVAALIMEFSPAPHRVAWGLVTTLALAGCVYDLATAMTGTATNLNLSYYILLGILCLVAAPRAFAAGRMGWSRNSSPRYS